MKKKSIYLVGYQAGKAVVAQNLSETLLQIESKDFSNFLNNYDAAKLGLSKNAHLGHRYDLPQGVDLRSVPKDAFKNLERLEEYLKSNQ